KGDVLRATRKQPNQAAVQGRRSGLQVPDLVGLRDRLVESNPVAVPHADEGDGAGDVRVRIGTVEVGDLERYQGAPEETAGELLRDHGEGDAAPLWACGTVIR